MKKVPKLIFSSQLEWFESIYCVASFGISVADKTIIRRGKNNAQAKTWKLTLHQNAQRKIIVFTTEEMITTPHPRFLRSLRGHGASEDGQHWSLVSADMRWCEEAHERLVTPATSLLRTYDAWSMVKDRGTVSWDVPFNIHTLLDK